MCIFPSNAWIKFLMFDWATYKRESYSFDLNLVIVCGGNVVWRLGKSGVTMWKEGVGGKIHSLALTQVWRSEIDFIDIYGTVALQKVKREVIC